MPQGLLRPRKIIVSWGAGITCMAAYTVSLNTLYTSDGLNADWLYRHHKMCLKSFTGPGIAINKI